MTAIGVFVAAICNGTAAFRATTVVATAFFGASTVSVSTPVTMVPSAFMSLPV